MKVSYSAQLMEESVFRHLNHLERSGYRSDYDEFHSLADPIYEVPEDDREEAFEKVNRQFFLENLRLGEALECYIRPERIILGTANEQTKKYCTALFKYLCDNIISMSLESAELVKHGINSFLAMSVVFIDNLADISEKNNASILDVVKGMKSDPRIGQQAYLNSGIGFSGGSLGRDLKVLEQKSGEEIRKSEYNLFGFIYYQNSIRKNNIVSMIEDTVVSLQEKNIGILGITYKPGTSTLRRSLPLEIIELLINKGANVSVYDPKADYSETTIKLNVMKDIESLSMNIDMLLLLTEWNEFLSFDWNKIINNMRKNYFFDTKNYLSRNFIMTLATT